ncbi:MAG: hypothetical protein WBO55_15350 [Rhizobiaceae bacterium]
MQSGDRQVSQALSGVAKSAEAWDAEFRSGKYRFLHKPMELARLHMIAAMIGEASARMESVEVADVGCGEGLLLPLLDPATVSLYIALDVSAEALKGIPASTIPTVKACVRLQDWDAKPVPLAPRITVASEVLYYDPGSVAHLVRTLEGQLPGSLVIVSCVGAHPDKPNWEASSIRLWRELAQTGLEERERRTVADAPTGISWDVAVYAVPPVPGEAGSLSPA